MTKRYDPEFGIDEHYNQAAVMEEDYSSVTDIYGEAYQYGSVDCNQCGGGVYKEAHGNAVDFLSDRLVKAWNRRVL